MILSEELVWRMWVSTSIIVEVVLGLQTLLMAGNMVGFRDIRQPVIHDYSQLALRLGLAAGV